MAGIFINLPGAQTSIQDKGRFGYQSYGMCPSGAMDMRSLMIANILVGNSCTEAGFEITLTGPEIIFQEDEVIAITGADMSPVVDGVVVPMYQALAIRKGQTLAFGQRKSGCRSYIAFAGGLDLIPLYGSRSTWVRIGIGPCNHALRRGDEIALRAPCKTLPNMCSRRMKQEVIQDDSIVLRCILGPQDYLFTPNGIKSFLGAVPYRVSNLASRQGYRLEGPSVEMKQKGSIVSDGIAKGAVQIQPNGQPIVLLSERQSTGGYAKIGNVISVDLPKIGQAITGTKIYFQQTDIYNAQKLLIEETQFLNMLEEHIRFNKGFFYYNNYFSTISPCVDLVSKTKTQNYRVTVNSNVYYVEVDAID